MNNQMRKCKKGNLIYMRNMMKMKQNMMKCRMCTLGCCYMLSKVNYILYSLYFESLKNSLINMLCNLLNQYMLSNLINKLSNYLNLNNSSPSMQNKLNHLYNFYNSMDSLNKMLMINNTNLHKRYN